MSNFNYYSKYYIENPTFRQLFDERLQEGTMWGWLNQHEKTVQQLKHEFSKFTGNSKVPDVLQSLGLLDFKKNPLSHKLNEAN